MSWMTNDGDAKPNPALQYINNLFQKVSSSYNQQATLIASAFSVVCLMLLSSCVWCVARYCRWRGSSSGQKNLDLIREGGSHKTELGSDSTCTSIAPGYHPIRKSGRGFNHGKNVITPDKNIEFVIPTIKLPAQPASTLDDGPSYFPTEGFASPSTAQTLSISQTSIPKEFYPQFIADGEETPRICYSLYYEAATQNLYVRLISGQGFPEDSTHLITVKLYPGRGGKQRSKEFRDSLPFYNQEFSFYVRKSALSTKILRFKGVETGSGKSVIGCYNLALKDLPEFDKEDTDQDLKSGQLWHTLDHPSNISEDIRLNVSLKWEEEPQPGLLTLSIKEASGLHFASSNDYTSSHVKVTLQEQGKSVKSRKTKLVRWGSIPLYDDVFVVTIPNNLLSQISFVLELIARGRLGSKVILGKVTIGSMPFVEISSSDGNQLWEDMCHQRNMELSRWLQLS